jgi:sporulation protein YlmC with PRC-barrel domain
MGRGRKMEIPIKATVQCTDGPGGEATHVVVNPAAKRVTRLVVKETRAPHVERVVPFKFVEEGATTEIRLRCSRQEMSKMKPFERTELVETDWSYDGKRATETKMVKHLNIPEGELAVDTHTPVRVTDGKAGNIGELVVDPASGSITHLQLRKGHVWAPKEVTVPISEVDRFGDRGVYLRMNRAGIKALPATAARRR